jgi:hypothetical protein
MNKRASIDIKQIKGFIFIIVLILTCFLTFTAQASFCRNYKNQLVCIISIKRSAKNYWEYRTSISVDGKVRPIEVYDCRQKIRIQNNKSVIPFKENDAGEVICNFFTK